MEWSDFDLFNDLDKVSQPLRSQIKWHILNIDILTISEAKKLLKVAQIYDYTFDIESTIDSLEIKNLRKI